MKEKKEEVHNIKQKFVQLPKKNINAGEEELLCPHCGRLCVKSEHEFFSESDGVDHYSSSVPRYECRYDLLDHTYRMSVPNP
jgi:hypothetical protein